MTLTLVRRVVREQRRVVVPLAIAAIVNIAAYLMAVVPLSTRVAAADARTRAAEAARLTAQRDFDSARAAADARTLAQKELNAFYRDILPPDLAGARRLTYRKLVALARESNLKFQRRVNEPGKERNSALGKLTITMVLEGQYEDVKDFIHALETSPEFMVIESVALAESLEPGGTLVLTIGVVTYFHAEGGAQPESAPPQSRQDSPGA